MSIANLQVSESDISKFLNHLIEAHTSRESTYFGEILKSESINNLINERIQILENIRNLAQLGEYITFYFFTYTCAFI
jgi:hypothetical protein